VHAQLHVPVAQLRILVLRCNTGRSVVHARRLVARASALQMTRTSARSGSTPSGSARLDARPHGRPCTPVLLDVHCMHGCACPCTSTSSSTSRRPVPAYSSALVCSYAPAYSSVSARALACLPALLLRCARLRTPMTVPQLTLLVHPNILLRIQSSHSTL
ncbi:hypothetical protein CRG98_050290, partial [Punica granatum]